jgi:hypothetical protein
MLVCISTSHQLIAQIAVNYRSVAGHSLIVHERPTGRKASCHLPPVTS